MILIGSTASAQEIVPIPWNSNGTIVPAFSCDFNLKVESVEACEGDVVRYYNSGLQGCNGENPPTVHVIADSWYWYTISASDNKGDPPGYASRVGSVTIAWNSTQCGAGSTVINWTPYGTGGIGHTQNWTCPADSGTPPGGRGDRCYCPDKVLFGYTIHQYYSKAWHSCLPRWDDADGQSTQPNAP